MAKDTEMDLAAALTKGPMPASEEEDSMAELEAAAGDFKDAVKSGDDAAIASAFKAMHTICNEYSGEGEE